MSEDTENKAPVGIVAKLRDYDWCNDDDIDEAADMLEFLLSQYKLEQLSSTGLHKYWFANGDWPLYMVAGETPEAAIRMAMALQKRRDQELKEAQ